MSSGEVLDDEQVQDLRGLGGGVFEKLIDRFLSITPERMVLMRKHFEASAFTELAQEAHRLKGSSGSIGARRFADTCHKIEKAGPTCDPKVLRPLLETLDAEFAAARDALSKLT